MKKMIIILVLQFIGSQVVFPQDITTVEATSRDISENLDLEAIASIFGESENLEDFENKLNDPELQISNLDLNEDGFVDYLRVVENSGNNTFVVTIQAVLGNDIFQDVATIDVEKDNDGRTYVQVVGDVYMYGPDYIVEPVYVYSPPVVLFFWGPNYRRWYSPYHWNYYPRHFHAWHPCHWDVYHRHVHINVNHRYYYPGSRRSITAVEIHNKNRRNDYAYSHPERSFSTRNKDVKNAHDITERKSRTQKSTTAQSVNRSTRESVNTSKNTRSGAIHSEKSFQGRSQENRKSSSQSNRGSIDRSTSKKESTREQTQAKKSSKRQSVNKKNRSSESKKGESRNSKSRGSSKDESSNSNDRGKSKRR